MLWPNYIQLCYYTMLFILQSPVDGTLAFVEAVEEVGGVEGLRGLDADVSLESKRRIKFSSCIASVYSKILGVCSCCRYKELSRLRYIYLR